MYENSNLFNDFVHRTSNIVHQFIIFKETTMKNIRFIYKNSLLLALALLMTIGCRKEGVEVIDVSFTADKTTVNKGEEVTFTFGAGADALSIYTGDAGKDFKKSRIALVEQQGLTEEQLRTKLLAERIDSLKEYYLRMPNVETVPADFKYTGGALAVYNGKLVPWDYSNSTNSRYIQLKLADGNPQTLTFKANKTVLPAMLNWTNTTLTSKGALSNVANNFFAPFCAFPDGFTPQSTQGQSVRFGVQVVIDGKESAVTYFTQAVRELLDNLSFDLAATITAWRTANPTLKGANGIDEVRLIFNADVPTLTDDDGDLLSYKGNVYIQEVRLGSSDNMIRTFNSGVTIPYVFEGKTQTYKYKYATAGTYTATMVATYIGRKKYTGDGYKTNRADEVLATEYEIERRFKTIEIKVN